jgi:hypothetical protein
MPRKKKSPKDMTSEEIARRVFPPKVLKELNKVAHEGEDKPSPGRKSKGKSSP